MHINDVDNKTSAVVLRRHHKVALEQTNRILTENLRTQDIPDSSIKKIVELCRTLQQEMIPKVDAIVSDFENGNINFDETVIAMFEYSMSYSLENGKRITQLIIDEAAKKIEQEEAMKCAKEKADQIIGEDEDNGTND